MKTHTQAFKDNVCLFGRELDSKITYTIDDVEHELGSEELNSVSPHYEGTILKSVMKQLDIDSNVDIPIGTIVNYQFGVKIGEDVATGSNVYEYINFGNYVVYSSEKQEDMKSYKIICYDKLLYSMVDYEDMSITYPITVRDYINTICQYLGLTFKNANSTFANYNRQIQNELYLDTDENSLGYTFRDVLDELAQVTASTICINEDDDELEIRYINNTGDTIDEEYLKDINVNFGEKYGPVNTIALSRSADSDVIYKSYPENLPDEQKITIKISNNQIMNFNDRDEYLTDILERLLGLEYYINDFSSTGIAYYNLCDRYNVQIGEDTYSCVMFNDEVNVTQGLEENVFTNMPEESETDYTKADKTDRRINQTYLIVDKQNQTIESVVSQTIDPENPDSTTSKVSRLTQRVDTLETEISNVTGMVMTMESVNGSVQFTDSTNESEPITIKVHPIGTNISYLYPRSNLYPSNSLYSTTRKIRFTNTTTSTSVDYELPDNLLYYDSENYDEFYLDLGSQTCQITKRCKYNADGTVGLLANETIVTYPYPLIQLTEGIYTVGLLGYNTGYISATLMAKNIYTDQFYTKVETDSLIRQTSESIDLSVNAKLSNYSTTSEMNSAISIKANEINQTVSQKVGNDEIISKINQTPETITINANKVNLQGYVTASDLSGTGTTTINGANITTGTINADRLNVNNLSSVSTNLGTVTSGLIANNRARLDLGSGILNIFNSAGGSMILSNAARLSATAGVAISSNSNGNISASPKNIDLKACGGASVYIGSLETSAGANETSSILVAQNVLDLKSASYLSYNGSIKWSSSSKATKENIKTLTDEQKNEVYELIQEIPIVSYDYKEKYSGQKNNYGFLIEDIEDTKLKTLLHISQNEINKDVKSYSSEDLTRLELIAIQELIKENKRLEERISQLEKKESDK